VTRKDNPGPLTREELEQQSGEELPDRELMSIVPSLDPSERPVLLPPPVEEAPE
jgi:hypothetical protein